MMRITLSAVAAYVGALGLAVVLLLTIALGLHPARSQTTSAGSALVPLGYCALSPLAAATALSTCAGGIPATANLALLVAEGNARWRDDGTAPTPSVGAPLASGGTLIYSGRLSALRVIAQSGSPTLNIAFYRSP